MMVSLFSIPGGLFNLSMNGDAGTLYVGGAGGGNYTTIQDAIDNASAGDTIYVYAGTYNENIVIDKQISLIGEGYTSTIIDGTGDIRTVKIMADAVLLQGFYLKIDDLGLSGAEAALDITTNFNRVRQCCFVEIPDFAILCYDGVNYNVIENNIFNGSYGNAIRASGTSFNNNLVANNTCNLTGYGVVGYALDHFDDNRISNNTFVSTNFDGITASNVNRVVIEKNTFIGFVAGIELKSAHDSQIFDNTFKDCFVWGIDLDSGCSGNTIYHNNFIDNYIHASDDGNNLWNLTYPGGGNYWNNWTTPDSNGDGFVDNPYIIPGATNQDNWPYTKENGWFTVFNVDTTEKFGSIQDAIDDPDTVNGHTIEVGTRVYDENIVVNKRLSLIGDGLNTTILNGGGKGDVVSVEADWVNISGFTITYSGMGNDGVHVDHANNFTMRYVNASGNGDGIEVRFSTNFSLNNCTLASNSGTAMFLYGSDNGRIENNSAKSNQWGFHISSSNNAYVTNNNITGNSVQGLRLSTTYNCTIRNNDINDGISISGLSVGNWNTHDIDISNTVFEKPIRYWKDQIGGTVPSGAGQVILANCTRVNVTGQNIVGVCEGISLGHSKFCNIYSNNVSQSLYDGIYVSCSYNNTIQKNTLQLNRRSIYVHFSSDNIISNHSMTTDMDYSIVLWSSGSNTFFNNSVDSAMQGMNIQNSDGNVILNSSFTSNDYGVFIFSSDGNLLRNNTLQANDCGLRLWSSLNNEIYHNNFIGNIEQARDDGTNTWDVGYPGGGNYWDNWTAPDTKRGVNQNLPGSDSIVDFPFLVSDGSSQDRYPWTTQDGWLSPIGEPLPVCNVNTTEYFNGIQEAIDDADTLDGHTITVLSGIYQENLVVNKTLTLIGESNETTIIDGGDITHTVVITSDFVNISGFNITGGSSAWAEAGLLVSGAVNCRIINNTIHSNGHHGISLSVAASTSIINNRIRYNGRDGILLQDSSNSKIFGNSVIGNGYGTSIINSDNCIFRGNRLLDDKEVYLSGSTSLTFEGNTITNGGLFIAGTSLSEWNSHVIPLNNTVNGKPLRYITDQSGVSVTTESGQIIIANCNDVVIQDLTISNATPAISIGHSFNCNVMNNTIENAGRDGIYFVETDGSQILNNSMAYSYSRIFLYQSDNNVVQNNVIETASVAGLYYAYANGNTAIDNHINNSFRAIYLAYSTNNVFDGNFASNSSTGGYDFDSDGSTFVNNTFYNNDLGLRIDDLSTAVTVYNNNFISNTEHAQDDGIHTWNNVYPAGGNFWDTWTGPDIKYGPDQDRVGSDGVVDDPYLGITSGSNQDDYPWTTPDGWMNYTEVKPVVNLITGESFKKIQAAIDDNETLDGHTISASPGTYFENINVTKRLSIIGAETDSTIIHGGGNDIVVNITTDWVNITGFTIRGGSTLIKANNSHNCTIHNNNILGGLNDHSKRLIQINNTNPQVLTNYTVNIIVPYEYDMQMNFYDIRFVDEVGNPLFFWVENYTESVSANVWVKFGSIPANGNVTINMTYGNSILQDGSDGANTFEFFDDFSSGTNWTSTDGRIQVDTLNGQVEGIVYRESDSRFYHDMGGDMGDFEVGCKLYWQGGTGDNGQQALFKVSATNTQTNNNQGAFGDPGISARLVYSFGTTVSLGSNRGSSYIRNNFDEPSLYRNWTTLRLRKLGNEINVTAWLPGGSESLPIGSYTASGFAGDAFRYLVFNNRDSGYGEPYVLKFYAEDLWVREYIANEPTYFFGSKTSVCGGMTSGIDINNAKNWDIYDNFIQDHGLYGIRLKSSDNCSLYHNDLINNTVHAWDDGTNTWNLSYPNGGNYFDNWTIPDSMSGPNQDMIGSDGFVDAPYLISGGDNNDSYPWTINSGWYPVRNIHSGRGYNTIQSAISAQPTQNGHTISVSSGTYHENIVVDKNLRIIGYDNDTTIIDGGGAVNAVLVTTDNVEISGFHIINASDSGIFVDGATNVMINNVTVDSNVNGMYVNYSSNVRIENSTITNNSVGIYAYHSDWLFLKSTNISNHTSYGLRLSYSDDAIITNNSFIMTRIGFSLQVSKRNRMMDNLFLDCEDGISITFSSDDNVLHSNRVIGSQRSGLTIYSYDNYLYSNQFEKCGIRMGSSLNVWTTQTIPVNNTVNGGPVYYYKGTDMAYGLVPSDAGQILLGNVQRARVENLSIDNASAAFQGGYCTDIQIMNNDFRDNSFSSIFIEDSSSVQVINNSCMGSGYGTFWGQAIWIIDSNEIQVEQNNCSDTLGYGIRNDDTNYVEMVSNSCYNNSVGIHLDTSSNDLVLMNTVVGSADYGIEIYAYSTNNTIRGNQLRDNYAGIYVDYYSDTNDLEFNNCSGNVYGIDVGDSDDCTIVKNNLSGNDYGLYLDDSFGNVIYYNDFIGNIVQARDDGTNRWNESYEIGGNYWSDWTSPDVLSGPNQDQAGSDGFVDNSYTISGGANSDFLPLVDMNLTVPEARISVAPLFLEFNILMDEVASQNVTISNLGQLNLSYSIPSIGGERLSYLEDFSTNPVDWTITHLLGTAWTWNNERMEHDYESDPNSGYLDSPVMDCSELSSVNLTFWHNWRADYSSQVQDGYVRGSIDGGNTFPYLVAEFHHNNPGTDSGIKSYDIPWADGQSEVMIRFDIYNDYDYYWEVDDFNLSGRTIVIDWLSSAPDNGTLLFGNQNNVTVTVNSTGLSPGTYYTNLTIQSNDPNFPEVIVQVNLTVTALFELPLEPGWNLISIPLIQSGQNLGTVLSSIAGKYNAVEWYDVSSGSWCHNNSDQPAEMNTLHALDHGMGIWINITEPGGAMLYPAGTEPLVAQQITLKPGWNLVGFPSLVDTHTVGDALLGVTYDHIEYFDPVADTYIPLLPTDLMVRGRGYWILCPEVGDQIWDVPL